MHAGSESHAAVPAAQPLSAPRMNGAMPRQKGSAKPVIPVRPMRLRQESAGTTKLRHLFIIRGLAPLHQPVFNEDACPTGSS